MSFFTLSEVRNIAKLHTTNTKSAGVILNEAKRNFSTTRTYDIFLSHAFLDADLVLGVKTLLESKGYSVYVDWIEDSHLNRDNVTKETAERIRERMKHCKNLYYLTSENAKDSKWMPWELGYFDGSKPSKVWILPLLEYEWQTFKGQEYLSLYPIVNKSHL